MRKKACAGFLLGSSCGRLLPSYPQNTMSKQSRSFGWEAEQKKFISGVWKLFDQLGVDNPTNALRKVCALQNTLAEKDEALNEYLELTNTNKHGNAKQRILSLMKKSGDRQTVAEKYNLDTSFLSGVGARWDKIADGKDEIKMIENLNKKLARQRDIVGEYYHRFLERVLLFCQEEHMSESETRAQVERWHASMVEDFDLLTAGEFFEKYYGDLHDLSVFPKETTTVLLVDALPFVREYTPAQVYQELIIEHESLGYVSKHTFDAWDKVVANATQKPHKEAVKEMRELMVRIVGMATHRCIKGPGSIPNNGLENNTLTMLLAHPDDNPYTKEFDVSDNTSLTDLVKKYIEFSQS